MIKFASHLLLLYVVYMCQKSLIFTCAFKCYQQNVSGFTLAGPPCIYFAFHYFPAVCRFCTTHSECFNSKFLILAVTKIRSGKM